MHTNSFVLTQRHKMGHDSHYQHFATKAVHAGQSPDPFTGAVMTPISLSSTFAQVSPGVKYPGGFEYSRSANPTRNALESCIAALENGKYALTFASGLGCTSSISQLFKCGDHIICMDDVYGGTQRFFRNIGVKAGLEFSFIDLSSESVEELLRNTIIPGKTKMIWLETPTNPTLKISNIKKIAEIAHSYEEKIILVVDNTFMSSYFQTPLDLGADISMHSCTKYMNGHSDVVMGVAITKDEEIHQRLRYIQNASGCIPSPFDSFLVLRSLKTLALRMQRHEENAFKIAKFLESHEKVEKVIYPGLESHPQHKLAKEQMRGFSGMITFYIKGDLEQAKSFLENVKIFQLAESLGGVESLVEHPAIMTHASVPLEQRKILGISNTLIRLSVGIEDADELLQDISNSLDKVTL